MHTPFFLSLLSGLLLWLSFPGGGGVSPLLLLALVPLLLAAYQAGARTSLLCGLLTGIVHYCALIYWIVIVVGKYGGLPWYISSLALLLLALYMSLYLGLFAMATRFFVRELPAPLCLFLIPALWVGLDWFRGVFLTGFPWMDLGYALYQYPLLIQAADLAGHHGVSFLVVSANVLVFLLIIHKASLKNCLLLLIPFLALFAGAGLYSVTRLQHLEEQLSSLQTQRVRIGVVQGNRDQSQKWAPAKQQETVETYITATETLAQPGVPLLVIWPETALPFYPPANDLMAPLQHMVKEQSISLLSGAPWYEIIDAETRKVKFYNSALLLTPSGEIEDLYFKNHLVPFGEYIPLKEYVPFLSPLVEAVGDFSPGTIDHPFRWEKAEIGLLICFESVFPELSRKWILTGANVLVNLTNDAWYGKSSAPHQSLGMAVFRAVETRRSLVRSANTGISAFIAPTGELLQQSPLFTGWAAADDVPLLSEVTFWVRYGYVFAPLCLFFGALGAGIAFYRGKTSRTTRLSIR